jgi:hypothetical protein
MLFKRRKKKNNPLIFSPSNSTWIDGFVIYVMLLTSDNPFLKILCNLHLLPLKLCTIIVEVIVVFVFCSFVLYENFTQIQFNLNLFEQVPLLLFHEFFNCLNYLYKVIFHMALPLVLKFIKVGVLVLVVGFSMTF